MLNLRNRLKPTNKSTATTALQKRSNILTRMGVSDPQTKNMGRNAMLSQIEHFDRSKLAPTPDRPIERSVKRFRELGVPRPQPKDMTRNVMLSQIETFDRRRLKPLQAQQRYIVSPHEDVRNLYSNTLGMSKLAMSKDLPGVRPVFKDEAQRAKFSTKVESDLASHPYGPAREADVNRVSALRQLKTWSAPESAMTSFRDVDTRRGAPVVYTQGHGSPGVPSISSDDKSEGRASGRRVAQQLIGMRLPKTSEVRANSCYSGTESRVPNSPVTRKAHRDQTVDVQHAGDWSKTFAGDLQAGLDARVGSHSRVRGYLGPTTQNPVDVAPLGIGGLIHKDTIPAIRVRYGTREQLKSGNAFKAMRSDAKRYGK